MKTLYDIQRTSQIRQQAQQNQQKEALARVLAANSYTMFVMNEAEFVELALNIKRQQGNATGANPRLDAGTCCAKQSGRAAVATL